MESITLYVGDRILLKRTFWGSVTEMIYAGMSSNDSFSVAVSWSKHYNSAASNLFLPADCGGFDLMDLGHVTVLDVSPEKLRVVWQEGMKAGLRVGRKPAALTSGAALLGSGSRD